MINVYIMSGPTGSGKTFHANAFAAVMASEDEDGIIVSADHYFYPELRTRLGQEVYFGVPFNLADRDVLYSGYDFDPSKLPAAHQQCMRTFIDALSVEVQHYNIIVDNTNIHSYEIAPYYLVGEAMGAKVEILRVEAPLDVCIKCGVHGVPEEIVIRMHETHAEKIEHPWEEGVMIPKQHMPWWVSRNV